MDATNTVIPLPAGPAAYAKERSVMQATRIGASGRPVNTVLLSPSHSIIVTCNVDGSLSFLHNLSLEEHSRVISQSEPIAMCWAKLSGRPALACLCSDAKIRLWKLQPNFLPSQSCKATVIDAEMLPTTSGLLIFSETQNLLAVATADRLKVWALNKKATLLGGLRSTSERSTVESIRFLERPRSLLLFYGSNGGLVEYNIDQQVARVELRIPSDIHLVEFISDDSFVICTSRNKLELHSVASSLPGTTLEAPRDPDATPRHAHNSILVMKVLSETTLICCMESGEIQVWDLASRTFRAMFRSHSSRIKAIASVRCESPIPTSICRYILAVSSVTGLELWEVCETNLGAEDGSCWNMSLNDDCSNIMESYEDRLPFGPSTTLVKVGDDAEDTTSEGLKHATPLQSFNPPHIDLLAVERRRRQTPNGPAVVKREEGVHLPFPEDRVVALVISRILNLLVLSIFLAMVPYDY